MVEDFRDGVFPYITCSIVSEILFGIEFDIELYFEIA